MSSIRMKMQYIGACSLLGQLYKYAPEDYRELIEQAMHDCAALTDHLEVIRVSGGFALEPKKVK
jgi:hypothetical protein